MTDHESLLTDADIAGIHDLMLDGHQTLRNLSWPKYTVQVERQNSAGEFVAVGAPVEVLVRYDNAAQQGERVTESQAASATTGRVRNYAPWDVQVGDVLVVQDDEYNRRLTITTPKPYTKYGTVRAVWTMNDGHA